MLASLGIGRYVSCIQPVVSLCVAQVYGQPQELIARTGVTKGLLILLENRYSNVYL